MARTLSDAFPAARTVELQGLGFDAADNTGSGWEVMDLDADDPFLWASRAYIADDAVLDAVRADGEVRSALRENGAVLLSPKSDGREVIIRAPNLREVPVRVVRHPYQLGYDGRLLVTPAFAADVGARVGPAGSLLVFPEPLDDEDRDGLEDLGSDLERAFSGDAEAEGYVQLVWEHDDGRPTALQLELLLTGVALIFCLFVVGVSLALAAAEGKDERDILTIAGAQPAMVARSAGARAWLMATLGAAMAVPIGFLPVVVVSWASRQNPNSASAFPIVFPSRTVGLLVVVVPLVVCGVAWAVSSTAQRIRPVRISTATFE
jgi:hypothetical protein